MVTFVRMPQRSLTEEIAILSKWYVAEGDLVKEGQYIFALETGKATFEVEAEASGTVLKILAGEGDEVPVRKIICVLGNPGEAFVLPNEDAPAAAAELPVAPAAALPSGMPAKIPVSPAAAEEAVRGGAWNPAPAEVPLRISPPRASPRARRLALERGLDYSGLCGTGPGGRILEDDVKAALAARPAEVPVARAAGMAQFTMYAHCDASELLSYRERWNSAREEKRTVYDFVAIAVNRLLPKFPYLNADGTFTLSDMGAWNVDFFTPVIKAPQTGILGVGTVEYRRKKSSSGMEDYPALALSLTVDHRAVDDACAGAFLKALCEGLEHFSLLLLV